MASPLGERVAKRLQFDAPSTPAFSPASRQEPRLRAAPGPAASPGARSQGPVRYGLPLEELGHSSPGRGSQRQQSVSYRVPSDDDLSDSDSEVTSTARPVPAVSRPGAIEEHRRLLEQQLAASVEARQHAVQASWLSRLTEVETALAAQLSAVALSAQRKQDDLRRADQELLRQHQQRRAEVLEKVQHSHRLESDLQEQQVRKLVQQREEEERKRREEEERKRQEEERKRREEEQQRQEQERKRQEEEARKAGEDEQRRKKEEAEKATAQATEAAAKAKQAAADKAAAARKGMHPCLRVAAAAQEAAVEREGRFNALQESVAALASSEDAATKKQRRDIEKKLTVHVQQICGTQQQVQTKCQDVYALVAALQGEWRTYAVLTLAKKVTKQYELVQLNNKAAFPLALVVVRLAAYVPELLDAMLGLLQKACPLAVPRSYLHDAAQITNNAYYRGMGFEEEDDPTTPSGKVFESPDAYLQRVEGLMLLYGAILQVDDPNPHGIAHAWSWLARALNHLPADRYTAKALTAVLRVAGYSLFMRYRGQFLKLLAVLQRDWLPELRRATGDDVAALATLLDSYVSDRVYRNAPEGRNMPAVDISSMRENRA